MRKFIDDIIMMVVMFLAFIGCENTLEQPVDDAEGLVWLNLVVEDPPQVKVVPDGVNEGAVNDYKIADFWLFEYKNDGTIAGSPRYFEVGDDDENVAVPILLPPAGTTYKCVIIANTHDSGFVSTLSDFSTLNALTKEYIQLDGYSDLYQEDAGKYDLMMNGEADITSASNEINCVLYRNVAKLEVRLKNSASSGVVLNSIQIKSVSDHLFYYDQSLRGAAVPSPSITQCGFVNMPVVEIESEGVGTDNSFTFYLPRNMRGTNLSLDAAGKNSNAPDNATYIEVMATNRANDAPLRYRFYPGKNMENDFNIEPNHSYSLEIDFSGIGDQYVDNRVEDLSSVTLEESNSYMIHPLPTHAQVIYAVPLSRINKFWKSYPGRQNPNYREYLLDASVEWEVEVIWQDKGDRVINFCNKDGVVQEGSKTFEGKGEGYFYFKPTKAAFGSSCNVIIGVKRKGAGKEAGYMWSWHLWITGYDPDEEVGNWKPNQYIYPVEGGAVHRYAGNFWMNSHYNGYIMDRNLGARSAERSAGLSMNAGLATQFGRKDILPMARNLQMYDIDGNAIADCIKTVVGPVDMYMAVVNPTTFYATLGTAASPHGDWIKNNPYSLREWNDIAGVAGEKSMFDPCPVGWCLPPKNIWQNFAGAGHINAVSASWSGTTNGWDLYIGDTGSSDTAFYPAAGWRNLSNGVFGFNEATEYWSAEAYSGGSGHNLYLRNLYDSSGTYGIPSANYKSYGMSIRCITDN